MTRYIQRWSHRLRHISSRQVDIALAVLVTAAGLLLFAFAGIGGSRRAGFLFLQNVEQRLLGMRFGLRGQRPHDGPMLIGGIAGRAFPRIGSFPPPRKTYGLPVQR